MFGRHETMFTRVFHDVQGKAVGRERQKKDLRRKKKRALYIVKNKLAYGFNTTQVCDVNFFLFYTFGDGYSHSTVVLLYVKPCFTPRLSFDIIVNVYYVCFSQCTVLSCTVKKVKLIPSETILP